MWLFLSIRLIIPINIKFPKTPIEIQLSRLLEGQETIQQTATNIDTSTVLRQNILEPTNAMQVLSLVWVIGIIIFALWQGIQYLYLKKSVTRWIYNITDERIIQMFYNTCIQMNVIQNIEIKLCKKVSTPMIIGFLNPMLLLPPQQFSDEDLSIIFKHELTHFKRHDLWYKLLLLITNSFYWFNPIIHYMVYVANKDIELACDDEVIKGMDLEYKKQYCQTILMVVHNNESIRMKLSTCFKYGKKSMLERLSNILNLRHKKKGLLMFLIVSLSVVMSGGLITFTSAQISNEFEDNIVAIQKSIGDITAEYNMKQNKLIQFSNDDHKDTRIDKTEREAKEEVVDTDDTAATSVIPKTDVMPETNTIPDTDIVEDTDIVDIVAEHSVTIEEQNTKYSETRKVSGADNIISLPASSYSFEANFKKKGQSTMISKVFQPENVTNMAITKVNSSGLVQVVNSNTGEIVFDEANTDTLDKQLYIPINKNETYQIKVFSTEDNDTVKIYVYGVNVSQ